MGHLGASPTGKELRGQVPHIQAAGGGVGQAADPHPERQLEARSGGQAWS